MIGSGSQVIKKIEQAPLFKPEENMQWAMECLIKVIFINHV